MPAQLRERDLRPPRLREIADDLEEHEPAEQAQLQRHEQRADVDQLLLMGRRVEHAVHPRRQRGTRRLRMAALEPVDHRPQPRQVRQPHRRDPERVVQRGMHLALLQPVELRASDEDPVDPQHALRILALLEVVDAEPERVLDAPRPVDADDPDRNRLGGPGSHIRKRESRALPPTQALDRQRASRDDRLPSMLRAPAPRDDEMSARAVPPDRRPARTTVARRRIHLPVHRADRPPVERHPLRSRPHRRVELRRRQRDVHRRRGERQMQAGLIGRRSEQLVTQRRLRRRPRVHRPERRSRGREPRSDQYRDRESSAARAGHARAATSGAVAASPQSSPGHTPQQGPPCVEVSQNRLQGVPLATHLCGCGRCRHCQTQGRLASCQEVRHGHGGARRVPRCGGPIRMIPGLRGGRDLNPRPRDYESPARDPWL